MGKTPHHVSGKFDQREWPDQYRMYWRARPIVPIREHVVYDLNYSAAEVRRAEREGRRPQPQKVKRTARWFTYTGAWTPSSTKSHYASKNQRANRRYVKDRLTVARNVKGDLEKRLYEKAEKRPRRILYDIW